MGRGARRGEARKTRPDINRGAVERAEAVLASVDARRKLRKLSSKRKGSTDQDVHPARREVLALGYDIDSRLPGRDQSPHVTRAIRYARRVVAGKVVEGESIQRACARFLGMIDDRRFVLRRDRAERVCRFMESMPHAKGRWKSRTIVLEDWQCWNLAAIFGFYWHDDVERRVVNTAYIEIARKNAKSTFAAGIGLYMLTEDGEDGAEVYSAATTHKQALAIFDTARAMAMKARAFQDAHGLTIGKHDITIWGTLNKFEALHAEGSTLDGLNSYCNLVDELHAHKNRLVYDVLDTATGSRTNPLNLIITTAGTNRAGICYEVRTYASKVAGGAIDDPSWFGAIYSIDVPGDLERWDDERVWRKANPNLGVSVNVDEMRRLALKARGSPASLNNFLTKKLNVWVNAGTAWLPAGLWDAAQREVDESDLKGAECVAAADIASRIDIASVAIVRWRDEPDGPDGAARRHYYVKFRHYVAAETVARYESDEDREVGQAQYSGWVRDGHLVATPGSVTDQDAIEEDLLAEAERFRILEIGFDPYQAAALMARIEKEGFTVVEVRPTVLNFSSPMKEIEALLRQGLLHHDGDPVAAWMISNVVCHQDAKENIYPRKESAASKIDGAVALIMAFNRVLARMNADDSEEESVYETRGVRVA